MSWTLITTELVFLDPQIYNSYFLYLRPLELDKTKKEHKSKMDDSFDDLDVPDDWLEMGSKRKNEESDFIVDKKLKSSSAEKSNLREHYLEEDFEYSVNSESHINCLTAGVDKSNNSVVTGPVVYENKLVIERHSDSIRKEELVCQSEKNEACSAIPPIIASSPISSPYREWSFNEPEFYANASDQPLATDNERVQQQTPFENIASFNSSATEEDQSLNQPDFLPNLQLELEEDKVVPAVSKANQVDSLDIRDTSILLENNVEKYVEHLSFTDDELRFISSEPGDIIAVETVNPHIQSSSKKETTQEVSLKKISSLVRDAKIISSIVPDKDFNDIYNTLLDHRESENRLDIATVHLLEKSPISNQTAAVDLFEEVQSVMSSVPHADANVVYTLLEGLPPSSQRVKQVINHLNPVLADTRDIYAEAAPYQKKPSLVKRASSINDPLLKNDPLFRDMRTIARIFPDIDRNEIYALLEANHDKSNRLQAVIDEFGQLGGNAGPEVSVTSVSQEDIITLSAEDLLEQDIEAMKSIFPDCDPNFLYDKLESMKDEPNRKDLLASELFEKRNYPKIEDIEEKAKAKEREQKEFARMEKVTKLDLTVEEFLERFPEPEKTFGDESTEKTHLYQEHAYVTLRNEFRMLKAGYLKVVLLKHKSHFYPAYQQIATEVLSIPLGQRKKFLNKFMKYPRSYKVPMPPKADEYFYHEYWFVLNEQKVKDYPKQKEEEKRAKIEEAKLKGELFECGCCFDDECLFEDLTSCPEGHLFCKTCVVRSTEAAFGEMKTKFPCLSGDCEQNIPLSILQTVIPANLFSKIVHRMQEEEILQANITDLVSCPFCPFATIMPNPNDKVFKCLNPECLKESCRLCQEPNHIPLRCNEVEKKSETNMRTFIENRISEAVMRKCPKCGTNFVKDFGCNKMTCKCGATSCYACKKHNIGYDHFNNNKECADTDPNLIHKRDMEAAAVKAKQDYLELHPEAANIELKTDVDDMIKGYVSSSKDIKNIPMIGPGGYLGREYGGNW